MRVLYIFVLILFPLLVNGQIHNRLIKFNVGISSEQLAINSDIEAFNDTSLNQFELVSKSPTFSYTHEFILGDVISISGKAGFQYLNVFYNNQHFGSSFAFMSVNPALSLFYNKKFEYYIKLQVGVNYWFNKPELIDNIEQRIFPEKLNVFAGVTIGGFNYYLSDKVGVNLELSIWSPELLSFGLSYRFFKGELPSIQELQNL